MTFSQALSQAFRRGYKTLVRIPGRMSHWCGQKRKNEEAPAGRSVSKRVSTSDECPDELTDIRLENEELKCEPRLPQETVNQLQNEKDHHQDERQIRDEDNSTLNPAILPSGPNSGKENEKQILEMKLHSCQSELNERDVTIVRLQNEAVEAERVRLELEAKAEKMQQQLCKELEGCGSYADGAATPFLLESSLKAVQTSAASYTKVFFEYFKRQNVDVSCALTKHFQNTYLTRRGHVTYLLKAWTFETLFQDFENENFSCGGASIFLEQTERRLKSFEYFQLLENKSTLDPRAEDRFGKFCSHKLRDFLSLWESSDPVTGVDGNLSTYALENIGAHEEEKVRLMESFKSVAKGVWILHKLSFSFQTRAEIFRAMEGTDLKPEYMESVVSMQDDERFVSKVGFMICPGFRLKRSILKCQVYLAAETNPSY